MDARIVQVMTIIKILTLLVFFPTHGFPNDGSCQPRDCTLQDWTRWGDCSQSCGNMGLRTRTRVVLQAESCGGHCNYNTTETETCNRQCCPVNCWMDEWYPWSCTCSATSCEEPGKRITCHRMRIQLMDAKCGGYCDDRLIEKTCEELCCHKDCTYGNWMQWETCDAQCEQMGTQIRRKYLKQKPKCGGKLCGEVPQQERECEGPCCPVDCVQGDWSHWSDCPATCGKANLTRTRYVDPPECGGQACKEPLSTDYKECEKYNNVDCKVSPWSQWTQCQLHNGRCGPGEQERIRSILVDTFCQGTSCPDLIEKKNCSGICCVQDCVISEWSEWTYCSATCGKGVSQRTRNITTEAACKGSPCPMSLLDRRECEQTTAQDCEFTQWTDWSACSTNCGDGVQHRSRTLLTPAYCQGNCVNSNTDDTKVCTSTVARRDCMVSTWTKWSLCVLDCNGGAKKRNRTILQNDACGGSSCLQYKLVVSNWSQWGDCQRNCFRGIKRRYRNITANPECGGTPCPMLMVDTDTCHPKCEQLCNQGVCSCDEGYELQSDGYSCKMITCKWPRARHCPVSGMNDLEQCQSIDFHCPQGQGYKGKCTPYCSKEGYVVKGFPREIECFKNRTWSYNTLYCGLINRAPLGITINATEIDENWPVGTCFAVLTTEVDNEPLDTHTYTLVSDITGMIRIKKNKLCLHNEASYEDEEKRNFEVTIKSTDFDGESVNQVFNFTVLNANDPPRSAKLSPNVIRENSKEGTQVGCLHITDDDPGQNMSVYLLSSAENTFELQQENGKSCVKLLASSDPRCYTVGGNFCTLNFEKRDNYYITILVEDDGEPKMMTVFDLKIWIVDVNEKPRKLTLDPENVLEEVEPGKALATIEVEDDIYQDHTFEILSNSADLFSVKGNDLVAAKKLDHESNKDKMYTLNIRVTDNGQPQLQADLDLVFGVGDVNEPPYDLHVTSDHSQLNFETDHPKVKENAKGQLIGTLSVYDPDEGEKIELKVISTYSKFTVVSQHCVPLQNVNNYCSAHILMEDAVDYEEIKEFQITVMATDKRKSRVTNRMVVTVMDANDPPKDILLNGQTSTIVKVPEDQRSFTLAQISAVDDDKGDNHEFFLSGEAANNFKVHGDQLMTSATADLDYETHGTFSLIIMAVDLGTPPQSFEKTFTISIIDLNESPSDIHLSNNEISEEATVGAVIGTLSAEDPDNYETEHQTFIFTLPDNGRGRFGVQGNHLVVAQPSMRCGTELCHLDFEKESQITITVRATDNGRPRMSYQKAFTIKVLDANDPPENLRLTRSVVRENMPAGTIVGTLNADNSDNGQSLTFEAVDATLFMVNDANHLVTIAVLDYEEKFGYKVKIKVTDNGIPPESIESVMTVTVLDVNEPPSITSSSMITVLEDTEIASVIANITVVDPDASATVTVSLTKFQNLFQATQPTCSKQEESSGTVCTLSILNLVKFDYDKKQLYSIPLVARDNKEEEIQQLLTIRIQNINDPPHDILLDGISTYKIDIDENVDHTDVATLSTLDRDKDQTHTYQIKYQDGDQFAISGDLLRLSKLADHETTPELHLTLSVTDSGSDPQTLEKNITVIVRDINEQPSQLALSSNTVVENSAEDTVVGDFLAEDPDNEDSDRQLFTFHLIDSADGRFKVQGDQLLVAQPNNECLAKGGDFCHLDYEKKRTHSIQVSVSDNGVPVKTNRFSLEVKVTDDNDAPRNLLLSDNEVQEVATADTEIGKLSVEDQDVDQTHTFTLLDDAGGLFKLSSANSIMKATDDRLDNKKTYIIKVQATDSGPTPKKIDEVFYLTVTGTEEAPRDISINSQNGLSHFDKDKPSLPEDTTVDSIVGTLSAEDNDPGSVIVFELLDDANGHFTIDTVPAVCEAKGTGTICSSHIKVSKALDFESNPEHSIVVKAVDGQGMRSSKAFTVHVTDVNEAPSDMEYIGGDILVSENHSGELLSVLTVTDLDKDDTHTFSLINDADSKFIISKDGQLKTAEDADLDYEKESEMEITVRVEDKGGLSLEKKFHVRIHDLNEKPKALDITNKTVKEMSPTGTVVGKLLVSDPDNAGDEIVQDFTYVFLDDAGGRFSLDGDVLKVAKEGDNCKSKGGSFCLLDYESKSSHDIAIEVTDSGRPQLTNTFTLTITVSNENDLPMDVSLDKTSISENMPVGTTIGTLSASDQDLDQELEFSITGGDAADVVRITGTDVVLDSAVDYEMKSSYTLTVTAKDTGRPPSETKKDFLLSIINNNEAPTEASIEPRKGGSSMDFPSNEPLVKENMPEGNVIGQLVVLDPDKEEEITAVSSNIFISIEEMGCITLTKGTRCVGNIKSEAIFDFEEQPSFTSTITITDSGGEKVVKIFTFSVTDENDPPQDILIDGSSEGTLTVAENSVDIVIATVTAVDADAGQTYSFAVVEGPQFFYFVGNKLKLTTSAQLNYEKAAELQMTLSVTDDGKPPAALEKHITVKVTDQNESPASVSLSKNEISEDVAGNTVVGTLSTDDPDNSKNILQKFTYVLTDDDDGRFKVTGDQLMAYEGPLETGSIGTCFQCDHHTTTMIAKSEFDYEIKHSTVVKGTVTDDGSLPKTAEFEFIIVIMDANDPPTNLQFSASSIAEDAKVGSVVGMLSADDEDVGQTLSFSTPDNDLLTIRENQLLVNGQLNYEKNSSIHITVTVRDDGNPSMKVSKDITVEVSDVNDRPHSIDLVPASSKGPVGITESWDIGKVVGKVVVEDEDSLERITLSMTAPTDGTLKLDDGGPSCDLVTKDSRKMTVCSINLVLGAKVDYEKLISDTGSISVEVTARDKGDLTITNRWDIPVTDTNDPPTDITIDGDKTTIPENMKEYLIGSLQSVDEDRKDTHIYQVLDDWEIFKVTRENELMVSAALNFEEKSEYEVRIKSMDSGSPQMTFMKTFTFTVLDINEKPSAISLSHDEVSMAAEVDSIVGFVQVTDPDNEDSEGQKQTFTCVADDDQDLFKINEDNSLRVKTMLPAKKDEIPISVTCTDSGVPKESITSEVKVKVMESADVPKSIKLDGSLEVDENKAPTTIGVLSVINALNQETVSGTFTFGVETKAGGTDSTFAIEDNSLVLKTPLNFEAGDELSVNITVSGTDDQDQKVSTSEMFLITVKDINEAPTHIGIYSDTVPENSPTGTVIGDLNTVDEEPSQTYTYTLIGVARGVETTTIDSALFDLFEINERTLVVGTDNGNLDFEKESVFSLLVESADSGTPSLSYTGTVRVRVLDRNDAPLEILLDNDQIAEESPVGTTVGTFTVTDVDKDQKHSCEVVNIQDAPFKIKDDVTLIVSRDELDHEGKRKYVVMVTCQDEGSDGSFLKVTSSFTINVTNVNDPPYNISMSSEVVVENGFMGEVVAQISAVDPDSDKMTFEVVDENDNFALKGDNTLIVNTVFNYEETNHVDLTIKVTDSGGLSASRDFTIKIGDVNEAPKIISLSKDTIVENASPGTVVGTLRTEDEDYGQRFTYTLTEDEAAEGYFSIVDEELTTGSNPLDFEKNAIYTVHITSTDDGDPPLKKQLDNGTRTCTKMSLPSKFHNLSLTTVQESAPKHCYLANKKVEFNITVTDVNEAPTAIITKPISSIREDADVGLVITMVNVEDQEIDQSYSCQVTDTNTPFMMQTNTNGTMFLILSNKLDYEKTPSFHITISCMDGPFKVTKDMTIDVANVNEAPTEIKLDGPMLLPATGKPGYVIGRLTAVDPDVDQSHTFTVRGANSDIIQVKEKNKLMLIKALPMDQLIDQASPKVVLTIKVVDNGYPSTMSLEQQLAFPITNIDLQALKLPEITITNKRVYEEAKEGTVIGALYNLNMSLGDNVVFEITEDVNKLFEIRNNTYLVLESSLLGITSPSVKVTVQARNTKSQQTTSRTITIFIRKSIKCKQKGKDCDFDAKCIVVNATYEYCRCNSGFIGDGYNCTDFDDCSNASKPCMNGASCVDGLNKYMCVCAEGFAGKQCEIKENEKNSCYDNKCKNKAVCEVDKNNETNYKCHCEAGWTGEFCETSIDDCQEALCYGEGVCRDMHLTYICECSQKREGIRCEYFKSSCSRPSCTNSEICVPKFDKKGHECVSQKDNMALLKVRYLKSRLDEVKARLVYFISSFGRFPSQAVSSGSVAKRKRRSTDVTANVHPYISSVEEISPGVYEIELIVQDSHDVPYTNTVILDSMEDTCTVIASEGQTETMICPAVMEALKEIAPEEKPTEHKEEGGTTMAGIGAGAGGGVVVIIIAIVIGVVCYRKHNASRVNDSRTNLQQNDDEIDEESKAPASPALPQPPPPPPLPPTNKSNPAASGSMTPVGN